MLDNPVPIQRREFLGRAAKLLTLGTTLSLSGCAARSYSRNITMPNILFITADNLGWHDLSCYGNQNIQTPNIDRIAQEGVRFENAFCVSSSCAPSRASLLTGQYPHTHGVTGLPHIHYFRALSPFHFTLPKLLSKAGYATGIEGKWHVSPFLPTSWYGYEERLSGVFPEDHFIRGTEKSIDFLSRHKNHRFFFQVNYKNSHRNIVGEYEYHPDFPVDPDKITVPEYMAMPDWPEIREDLARYYSQNLRMERMIGELLQALDALGLSENTLVLFMSDNGPHYPGMISTLYDRGVATPLIARWPGKIPQGLVVPNLVSSIDIMPTFLEAAGLKAPAGVQGRSILPLMTGRFIENRDESLFFEQTDHVHYIPCRAVRTHQWKYIRNYSDNAFGLDMNNHDDWAHRMCDLPGHPWKTPRPREELYHLKNDPQEQTNLATHPDVHPALKQLRSMLDQHMQATNDPFFGKPFTNDFRASAYEPVEPGFEYW